MLRSLGDSGTEPRRPSRPEDRDCVHWDACVQRRSESGSYGTPSTLRISPVSPSIRWMSGRFSLRPIPVTCRRCPPSAHPSMTQRGGGPGGGPKGDSDALGSPVLDSGSGSQQVLFGLANGTGGLVVRNTTDLLGGLQNIAQEQEQYYALTYVAPESKEGTCHAIRVKVDRKGTTVRSRTSYCTSKPMDLLAGTDGCQGVGAARGGDTRPATSQPPSSCRIFILRPTWRASTSRWRFKADTLKFENKKGKLHAELNFLGVAASADGEVRARFSDALKLDFDNPAQIENLKGKSLHYEKEFKIVPGQYTFTVAFTSR